jgi:hypothetical protein
LPGPLGFAWGRRTSSLVIPHLTCEGNIPAINDRATK